MATEAVSRPGFATPSSPFHASNFPLVGPFHEAHFARYTRRNRVAAKLVHGNERIGKNQHRERSMKRVMGSLSWQYVNYGKRQSIVGYRCSDNGGSWETERAEESKIPKSRTTPETDLMGNGDGRSCEAIWRKVKEVTTAILLSAIISFPDNCDYNSALAEEMTLVSPSPSTIISEVVSQPELDNPDCATRFINDVEDESSNSEVEPVTNESVVEEAWQLVNENFLDARHHSWSEDEWARIREDFLKRPIRSRMGAYSTIRGMLATLDDPYTRFLTPNQFTELSKYDVTGVGLNIGELANRKGQIKLAVLGIVLGSPAQMMGVRQGDELLAVNGKSVQGLSAFEASSLIQGPKGTPVSIEIRHSPCEDVKTITFSRQQDVRTPVYYRLEHTQDPDQLIGYIRLREFNALAKRDLVIAMKRLQEAGAMSFLLDLQDNPGGLVQAGIEIARLFLDGGNTVVQTVGRDPTNYKSILASNAPFTKAPLMVLVNDRTASASEIVAAALHDNCRAVLVGNRTFGKGLIQSVYELSDGSGLILTVGKYITPGRMDIDRNGIEPDFKNLPGMLEAKQKLGSCSLHLKKSATTTTKL
jgi:carboxyl-terminal processing protease